MKRMTVFDVRKFFAKTLEYAKKDVIIVTRYGKPVAAIQAIDNADIEALLLERSQQISKLGGHGRRGKPMAVEARQKQAARHRRAARTSATRRKRHRAS
jgi:antitoxin (DNA-binding transcriptional repressor) of toxin-antitoxin stability system